MMPMALGLDCHGQKVYLLVIGLGCGIRKEIERSIITTSFEI